MRAWGGEDEAPKPGDASTLDELRRAGARLPGGGGRAGRPPDGDPADATLPPGAHRHGDEIHLEAHAHPHVAPGDDGRPVLGIVGGGPVGLTLGAALTAAGWQVGAVASRDPGRRERLRQRVPGARAFAEAAAVLDECHLLVLAVPDDAIAAIAGALHLYSGQAVVHTSGVHGAEILVPAMAAGTSAGSFHPLVAFADVDRALAALPGATIAIDGDDAVVDVLAEMAESIKATPVRLAPGTKASYHAAASLAAGGLVALLDTIVEVAAAIGLDEAGALAVYGALAEQALANARTLGTGSALTGPFVRGDLGTIDLHLEALARTAPRALGPYEALARRAIDLAEERRGLAPEVAAALRSRLAGPR